MTLNKFQLGDIISVNAKIVEVSLWEDGNIYYTIVVEGNSPNDTVVVSEDSISTVF